MKKFILCAVLCAFICQTTGCGSSSLSSSENSSTTDAAGQEQTASTSASTTQSGTAETQTEPAGETAESSEPAAEPTAEAATPEPVPTDKEAALSGGVLKVISPDNVFIDYKYMTGQEGTKTPESCGTALDSAVLALKQTEDYKKVCDILSTINAASGSTELTDGEPSSDGESFYDFFRVSEDGGYEPIFHSAFINDFDGDGKQEQFILLKFPIHMGSVEPDAKEFHLWRRYYLAFVGSDGSTEILDSFWNIDDIALLDYGADKQLIISSTGVSGADDHDMIFGVVNGKAVVLYATRGGFEKWNCFLTSDGWQGYGAFMYYDTAAKEYRGITGIILDKEEVAAMDTANSAPYKPDEYFQVTLIGGKYYCFSMGMMDRGMVYTFENGEFKPAEGIPVRTSYEHDCVLIDDIDAVIAGMKLPED